MRNLLAVALLSVSACQCLEPVGECSGTRCATDAGKTDGGSGDGGPGDSGTLDAGFFPDGGVFDSGFFPSDGGACELWDGRGVGKCAAVTGYVFQGTSCQGQCVLYPISTPGIFKTLSECAGCGCDTSKLVATPAATFGPGMYCDQLDVRLSATWLLEEAFPGVDAGCIPVGSTSSDCTVWRRQLGDAGYARACAATLLPGVTQVRCLTFLP